MRLLYFFLLLTLFPANDYAQIEIIEENLIQYKNLDSLDRMNGTNTIGEFSIYFDENALKEIIPNYFQVDFNVVYKADSIYEDAHLNVIIDSLNNVAYYSIDFINWEGERILTKNEIYTENFKKLEHSFYSLYSAKLAMEELFNSELIYGGVCAESKYSLVVLEISQNLNQNLLKKLLQNPTPEIQLYAYEAFLLLKKKNVSIEPEILLLIELLREKGGIVQTCSGCSIINSNFQEMLKEIELKTTPIQQ